MDLEILVGIIKYTFVGLLVVEFGLVFRALYRLAREGARGAAASAEAPKE